MTATQAYQVLGVRPGAGLAEIQQAYRAALQVLQLQLVPGQPATVRQRAQDQIAELKSAFEFLKNLPAVGTAVPGGTQGPSQGTGPAVPQFVPIPMPQVSPRVATPMPPIAGFPAQPMPMPRVPPTAPAQVPPITGFPTQPMPMPPVPPVTAFGVQPPPMPPNPFGPGPTVPSYPWVLPAGFVMAAAVTLVVVILCVNPSFSWGRGKTARLRVLSVPWSQVRVNGEALGPSGQVEPFALKPGVYRLELCQGQKVLSRRIELSENAETLVEAQLEKGQIHVAQRKL